MNPVIDQLEKELSKLECDHPLKRVRYREASNGTKMFKLQCSRCGEMFGGWIPHKDVEDKDGVEPIDDWLVINYRKTIADLESELNDRKFKLQQVDVLEEYREYLQSPEWRIKRTLVLDRCMNVCEGCGLKTATQVHHLTYRNIGNEFLFELKGLCVDCHRRIHPDKVTG